jgi:hypothetical protein
MNDDLTHRLRHLTIGTSIIHWHMGYLIDAPINAIDGSIDESLCQ